MSPADQEQILRDFKRVVVVGLSPNPSRPSHSIALYLQSQGYEVVGVHPAAPGGNIAGIRVYKKIHDVPGPLEIVDVFRASENIPALVDELIPLKPKVMWLQEGISHADAQEKAEKAGIQVVEDSCILKVHRRIKR